MLSLLCGGAILLAKAPAVPNITKTWTTIQKGNIDKKDTAVEPTSWGNVEGRVYSSIDGTPIKDAFVTLQTDKGFEPRGRSTDKTDELGTYRAQCILGRISHNLDVGRALLTSGLGLLFGAANNSTLRIDASRVAIRVTAPGYKEFEGVVIARWQNAGKFQIDMHPILLAPEGGQGESISANGWTAVRIENAFAEPSVAKKGELVKLYVDVKAFGKNPKRNIEIGAVSRLWKGEKILKQSKNPGEGGTIRFETDYRVNGREKSKAERVEFYIRKSLLEFNRDKSQIAILVQTSTGPEDEQRAGERLNGLRLMMANKPTESQQVFKKLAENSNAPFCDLELLVAASSRVADYTTEAEAWKKLVLLTDKDDSYEVSRYVRALYRSKRYDEVPPVIEPLMKSVKQKDWPKIIEAKSVAFLGLAYVQRGAIAEATKLNEDLLKWPTSGLDPDVIEFRNNLRLAQVEQLVKADPESPEALAEYGRAYLDMGRYEEAVAKLNDSLKKGKDMPAVRRDLAWAALQIRGRETSIADLQTAVNESKAGLNIDQKGKQESKDFFSWNQYAVLLYALAEDQKATGSADAAKTAEESIAALRKALTMGRKGAIHNSGAFSYTYGYLSGAEVAISGFAYPQANSSFVLLDSLKRLSKNPDDYLALFNRSSALLDLGQFNLAKASLDRLMQVKPNYTEGMFLYSLLEAKTGGSTKAQEYLNKVLAINPIHPRANLTLAELLAQDGDVAGSAERLATHAKYYGDYVADGK